MEMMLGACRQVHARLKTDRNDGGGVVVVRVAAGRGSCNERNC